VCCVLVSNKSYTCTLCKQKVRPRPNPPRNTRLNRIHHLTWKGKFSNLRSICRYESWTFITNYWYSMQYFKYISFNRLDIERKWKHHVTNVLHIWNRLYNIHIHFFNDMLVCHTRLLIQVKCFTCTCGHFWSKNEIANILLKDRCSIFILFLTSMQTFIWVRHVIAWFSPWKVPWSRRW
jgi:hypothetical protein